MPSLAQGVGLQSQQSHPGASDSLKLVVSWQRALQDIMLIAYEGICPCSCSSYKLVAGSTACAEVAQRGLLYLLQVHPELLMQRKTTDA